MLAKDRHRPNPSGRVNGGEAQARIVVQRRHLARATLTALIVPLCVLAQFSGLAHLLLVRHVTCPVHGELMHAGDREAAPFEHVRVAGSPAAVVAGVQSEIDSYDDEHCAVVGHRREQALPVSSVTHGLQIVVAAASKPAVDAARRCGGLDCYVLAPKTSPPS